MSRAWGVVAVVTVVVSLAGCGTRALQPVDGANGPGDEGGAPADADAGPLGSFCAAAAADPWAISVRLDASDCAMRPAQSCAVGPDNGLDGAVGLLAMSKCAIPPLVTLRVELASGCPTLLELNRDPDNSIVECLQKVLSVARWSCPGDTTCALFEWDTLP
jgi:hypothetical protein